PFQAELIAVREHLFDFGKVELALLGVEVHPGTVNANDVEFVLMGDGPQHFMPERARRIRRTKKLCPVNEFLRGRPRLRALRRLSQCERWASQDAQPSPIGRDQARGSSDERSP